LRYFFHISYNGFNYHGWQKHVPHSTVQEILEFNLGKLLKTKISISGCGRTDAGVHASQYFFHLDTEQEWSSENTNELVFRLNKMLPHDIVIFDIIHVDNKSHAQYHATKRTYDYFIHTYKDPFLNHFSYGYQGKSLGLDKMKQAVSLLTNYKDYKAFCKSPDKYEDNTLCNITSAELFSDSQGNKLRIQISSNRFLRGMMRAIVSRLIQTGAGDMSLDQFENYLISNEPEPNILFAPPQGLYLSKIVYPFISLPCRAEFFPLSQPDRKLEWNLL